MDVPGMVGQFVGHQPDGQEPAGKYFLPVGKPVAVEIQKDIDEDEESQEGQMGRAEQLERSAGVIAGEELFHSILRSGGMRVFKADW
jgi:hypothetical protein